MDKAAFQKALKNANTTQRALAKHLGVADSRLSELKTDDWRMPGRLEAKAALFLQLTRNEFHQILYGPLQPEELRYNVVGYVGAGSQVFPIDDHPQGGGLEEVELAAGLEPTKDWVVLKVRGDSMYPQMEEGWHVWYRREYEGVEEDECLNRICVVKITDGPTLVKKIRRGTLARHYNLESTREPPKLNQRLDWAAPVAAIIPK